MDKFFFRRHGTATRSRGVSSGLPIFQGILKWLAALLRFTDEEQQEAGIVLGKNQRYR